MAILRCKMCGAMLPVQPGVSVVECESCLVTQTVPSMDNEKKLTLFTRAERLRSSCEFDKAAGVYESIISDFPTEAEAYWGLLLCKYGIEYVDDPATGKKVPTCHRSSFYSVLDDADYEQTLENADSVSRRVYREEARQIEQIRQGIVSVSAQEEPYDIFICYKETAADGSRTLDSVIAQDIYDQLKNRGYRVFFSRITLEDKLGVAYEPYIFAALNSAKIMLVVGTDYEHFNAIWVKNEWNRFLQLMASNPGKTLIPVYKCDAYDMPKEFVRLQAQDYGKVGAMQDLLRGIEKLLPKQSTAVPTSSNAVATTDSLLKRAYMFLADGDLRKAKEYLEKVLDVDPECVSAYIGELMVEVGAQKEEDLSNCASRIDLSPNYKKIMQYGDSETKSRFEGYNKVIMERVGVHKARMQALESKKQQVLQEIQKSDSLIDQALRRANSLADAINNRSSGLQKLKQQIETMQKEHQQALAGTKRKGLPVWLLVGLLLLEIVCLVAGIPEVNGELYMCLLGGAVMVICSVFMAKSKWGALIGWSLLAFACVLLVSLIMAMVEYGGLGRYIVNVVFGGLLNLISGRRTAMISADSWRQGQLICAQIFFIIAIIRSAKANSHISENAKRAKQLNSAIAQATASYEEKVNNDQELLQLHKDYEIAKGQHAGTLHACRQNVQKLNKEYLTMAESYRLKPESLLKDIYQ